MTDEQRRDDVRRPRREADWERRRRLAEVFGDVLPETTRDERDAEAPDEEPASERWLRSQVPPHHG
ncbi:hypothetical protein [Nocardioides sp. TF02-7]|uniref:hypothetical protein n=1 Tax=Nocardioides sp. TF02-7 TaxID=2917724 RepID=UPI001F056D07|nr:hypothetical protein [Nocardioides sp. TF02-7]UMG93732.1 hypothetical protein MF408_06055 [Nocardioides sp. TF02-7]